MKELIQEKPYINTLIQKLESTISNLQVLITVQVSNNVNYERSFYEVEKDEVEIAKAKFDKLKIAIVGMNKIIEESNAKREYVVAMKYEQPELLAQEYHKLLDVQLIREKCKKKHAKSKHKLRDFRDRYGDMHLQQITQ